MQGDVLKRERLAEQFGLLTTKSLFPACSWMMDVFVATQPEVGEIGRWYLELMHLPPGFLLISRFKCMDRTGQELWACCLR